MTETKTVVVPADLLLVGIMFALAIPAGIYHAWSVRVCWNWLAPVIGNGMPLITTWQAWAICLLIGLFYTAPHKDMTGKSTTKIFCDALGLALVKPPIMIAMTWLVLLIIK